ncbi:MAG: hypothetical protein ABGY41_03855 [Candidatus Poribacteria bacterium]
MRGRAVLNAAISTIPVTVVVAAIFSIVHGLVRFLRGDETYVAVIWAIAIPVLVVPAGLGVQMALVRLASRLYGSVEYEAEDDSPFL